MVFNKNLPRKKALSVFDLGEKFQYLALKKIFKKKCKMKAVYIFLLLFSQYCKHKASKMLDFLKVMYRRENSKVLSDAQALLCF